MQEIQETQTWYLGQEDPLEEEMATHSSILAWKIPWTVELGGLQPLRLQTAGHDWGHTHRAMYLTCCCCSATKLCLNFCDPMNCSTLGFPVLLCLLEFAQTHVHWVCGAIQSSCPLSPPSPPAINLSQHQGLFQWVSSLHQMAKVS